jgi:HEAT repeat protein
MRIAGFVSCLTILLLLITPIPSVSASRDSSTPGAPVIIRVSNNLLTVKLKDVPLEKALTEIANQAGIQIVSYGPLEGIVSADFTELPLDEGLRRLIRDLDHIFIYHEGKSRGSEPEVKKVLIYSKTGKKPNEGLRTSLIGPQKRPTQGPPVASPEFLVKALEDKDPEVRQEAVDRLAESKDERAVTELIKVLLKDKDEDVRESAADALGELGDERAVAPLVQALKDRDAGVRESAVDALRHIGGEAVIRPLMDALKDEDEDVREAAAEALKELTGRDISL